MQDSPAGAMAIAGVVGGVFAASASHPFDTIKTRMQAHMYSKPEYLTWTSTAATIYNEGGILNFWRGLLPRMTRIIGESLVLEGVQRDGGAVAQTSTSQQQEVAVNDACWSYLRCAVSWVYHPACQCKHLLGGGRWPPQAVRCCCQVPTGYCDQKQLLLGHRTYSWRAVPSLASCPAVAACCLPAVSAAVPAAATFILINVRSTVVGYLEAERADPVADPTLPSEQVPQLAQ